ncbi:MAG: MBL fold metallo-hydrolase [Myxococcales bacterium]|nr:MBL fold metallo-hydrolase [Myxococcales bacterium]
MLFRQLFDPESATYTYLLADSESREAVIIDPVRDQVERDALLIEELGLKLIHVLETHVHADHVTSAGILRRRFGAKTATSHHGGPACADHLLHHEDVIKFGKHALEVRETPGHTDGCLTYVTADRSMAFTGDALLIRGCGRTDFQQGDAHKLYHSVHDQIFSLPDAALLYPAHDYKGRTVTSVAEEKAFNPRLGGGKSEAEFVQIMNNLHLARPKKIDEALPANLRCGLSVDETVSGEPVPERAWAPVVRSATGVPEVFPEWVLGHLGEFRVIDVREPHELASGKIEGAENVPLATVREAAAAWDPNQPLVTVCRSGGRSGRAALDLESLGFRRVASMAGGMLLWASKGLQTAR